MMGMGHQRNTTHFSSCTSFSVLLSPHILEEVGLGEGHRPKQWALCCVRNCSPKAADMSLCLYKRQHPRYKVGRLGWSSAATLLAFKV